MTNQKGSKFNVVLYRWDAHYRITVSLLAAAAVYATCRGRIAFKTDLVSAWDSFAFLNTLQMWIEIWAKDPYHSRRRARLQDASRTILFILVVCSATASLAAVGLLIGSAKQLGSADLIGHVGLSFLAIMLSWTMVHTIFALRYAHYYYFDAPTTQRDKIEGGLIFPGDSDPNYLDFAYFSFIIGMTCQVSDVQITSSKLRGLALVHGVISFGFNTTILAVFINIVASLL